jgi:hypothetical protein
MSQHPSKTATGRDIGFCEDRKVYTRRATALHVFCHPIFGNTDG